ncbi:MAG TPA: chlorite dismutase family protein [Actinomycetota bacterium]|nr:chlorite dismutase family protein [Actinomycetota bacterium]
MSQDRAVYRYAVYAIDPAWRRLPAEDRRQHKKELAAALSSVDGAEIYPYSTVGLREDGDFLLWTVAWDIEPVQRAQAAINACEVAGWLTVTHSFLAMTRKSQYLKGHSHDGQEHAERPGPRGDTCLFVYPMDKERRWYRVPFEERRAMMVEHFKIGHKYPAVKIHTGYSFGIDDQEFVVAFEGESLAEFLELVEELRGSGASAYTARDVPIFTCVKAPMDAILDQLDGAAR